ncbi:MAG: tRNA (N(6)-L-threonylcarbamoyladenosine(37)-C(2))-methylthiotransferase MtaB [Prevotellaceae bacterium]|nr:tRNA (N(6)-L-threonylcarbamoyladenosine(37)-C(2))-methylthiotransferase MtaB [Prevotellaceae bacterium]
MNQISCLAGKKAAYFTLGCKLNFAETSSVAESLEEVGVAIAKKGERADLCIVNTCSVTEVADSKSRQTIRRMAREHEGAIVVVLGCYAQLKPEEIGNIEGVHLIIGTEQKAHLLDHIAELMSAKEESHSGQVPRIYTGRTAEIRTFVPSCSCGNRTRYFLKVQDGCDYYCTYCTIPFARGRSRNGTIASLVEQAREVADKGGKEIVITGVNIGDFGKSTGESFLDLIKRLDDVTGISRYRISSIEPDLLTDEVLEFCARSRAFMPHFHLPLQSGSDEVLRLMRRHYDTAFFASRVEEIRALMPDAFIGVDVIVGARGETDELFKESLNFMERMPVSQYHVFSYSERPGTMALKIPHCVSATKKHERSQLALDVSERKTRAFYENHVNTIRPVLLEHSGWGQTRKGFTDNYIKVEVESERDNEIVNVRLDGWNNDNSIFLGTIV